jgi:hypothetical protein
VPIHQYERVSARAFGYTRSRSADGADRQRRSKRCKWGFRIRFDLSCLLSDRGPDFRAGGMRGRGPSLATRGGRAWANEESALTGPSGSSARRSLCCAVAVRSPPPKAWNRLKPALTPPPRGKLGAEPEIPHASSSGENGLRRARIFPPSRRGNWARSRGFSHASASGENGLRRARIKPKPEGAICRERSMPQDDDSSPHEAGASMPNWLETTIQG